MVWYVVCDGDGVVCDGMVWYVVCDGMVCGVMDGMWCVMVWYVVCDGVVVWCVMVWYVVCDGMVCGV